MAGRFLNTHGGWQDFARRC